MPTMYLVADIPLYNGCKNIEDNFISYSKI
jgi:hypothetical protein